MKYYNQAINTQLAPAEPFIDADLRNKVKSIARNIETIASPDELKTSVTKPDDMQHAAEVLGAWDELVNQTLSEIKSLIERIDKKEYRIRARIVGDRCWLSK